MEIILPNRLLNDDTYRLFYAYLKINKNKISIILCDGSIKYCETNPLGKSLRCNLCKFRALRLSKLSKSKIFFSKSDINNVTQNFSFTNKFYNSAIGTLASHEVVSLQERLSKKAKKSLPKLVESSRILYSFLTELIFKEKITKITTFNGRYSLSLAAFLATKENKISFLALELWGRKVPIFGINRLIHDANHVFESCYESYSELNINEIDNISNLYFNSRWKWGGAKSGEVDFTSKQIISQNNIFSHNSSIKIAVFPSSNHEYNFLPEGYKPVSQAHELKNLIFNFRNYNKKIEIIIRLHPNLSNSPKIELKEFLELEELSFLNNIVRVVKPKDKMSTYQLMREAHYIVSFASFSAVEANFLGKCVVQIGPSRYHHFSISHKARNGNEAYDLITSGKILPHPKKGSKIFAVGFMRSTSKNLKYEKEFFITKIGFIEKFLAYVVKYFTRYN